MLFPQNLVFNITEKLTVAAFYPDFVYLQTLMSLIT